MATIKRPKPSSKMTPMQRYKRAYPDADTSRRGDQRFDELPPGIPARAAKRHAAMEKAFTAKYGKKPAYQKTGGKVSKAKKGKSIRKADFGDKINQFIKEKPGLAAAGAGALGLLAGGLLSGGMRRRMMMGGMGPGMMKKGGKISKRSTKTSKKKK